MEEKETLYKRCKEYVEERLQVIQHAMDQAQESANQESKSSAGDKYETGRAMAQLEKEKLGAQMVDALRMKQIIDSIDPVKVCDSVQIGSLVRTTNGTYYISISAGKMEISGEVYFAISLASPIAQQIRNLREGDQVNFNRQLIKILSIQ
jgi:transcription elongation GreA/GreB family factor